MRTVVAACLTSVVLFVGADTFAQATPTPEPDAVPSVALKPSAIVSIMYEGTDIGPLVEYFRPVVRVLTQQITVYNWSKSGALPFWNQDRPEGDIAPANLLMRMAAGYWKTYGGPGGSQNNYGFGLYAALDPVATSSYGGVYCYYACETITTPPWLVIQMNLPVGFKLLDLGERPVGEKSEEASAVLKKFGCPPDSTADTFLEVGGERVPITCRKLARKLFRDILPIDGFAYFYSSTRFSDCDRSTILASRAFVLTSNRWVNPKLVKAFSSASRAHEEDRIRIQTLFLEAVKTEKAIDVKGIASAKILAYLRTHPDSAVEGSTTKCAENSCVITIKFCDSENKICEDVALDPVARPGGGVITKEDAQKTAARRLLWPDLEGKFKSATISTWLKSNKFGCSGKAPYETYKETTP